MITSFIQYLLMAPSYIAVLNVYAVRPPAPSPAPIINHNSQHHSLQMSMIFLGELKATIKFLPI